MREIFLVGVNHKYQFGPDGVIIRYGPPEAFAEFRQFLRDTIAGHGIRAVAEEMSLAALRRHSLPCDSIPCRIAAELNLPHRYCDPDPEIQERLNTDSNDKREKYWIQELMSLNVFPVLFVLGCDHIETFQLLLLGHGLTPLVVARDWQP